jgi:hypothetical protein
MAVNLLTNVRVAAISIVTKGANRKRFFLRKEAEGEDLIELPSSQRILKAADWSAVYAVVAEPEWLEDAGQHGDQEVPDRWASEDEIRKAAHEFVKGGGLINLMHTSLEPHGQLVESAIALDDFEVNGETIRKGSWYIAFEPNAATRNAIEAGEFSGISIQGTGTRSLVEKAGRFTEGLHPRGGKGTATGGRFVPKSKPAAPGPKSAAKTPKAEDKHRIDTASHILHGLGYAGQRLSTAVKDFQQKHDLPVTGRLDEHTMKTLRSKQRGRRKKQRAPKGRLVAKESTARDVTMEDRVERGLLHKIAEKVGLSTEEISELEKAYSATFSERMAERDFEDELPQAFDILRSVVCGAFYPSPADANPPDPAQVIADSLDEFKAWALDLLENTPLSKITEQIADAEEWSLEKATLTAAQRKELPKSAFVFPEKAPDAGSYPIHDMAHAKNALARSSGKPEEAKVRAAVHRRYPQLKPKKVAKASATDRAAQIKQAMAIAHKKHPDGVPKAVTTKIFKDPAAWLAANGDKAVAKADGSTDEFSKVGDMDEEHTEERSIDERMDAVEESLSKLDPNKLAEAVAKAVKGEGAEETPTPEDLSKKLDEFTTDVASKIEKLGEDVKKLGSGGSVQPDDINAGDGPSSEEKLAKALEERKLPAGLAGIV